MTFSNDKRIAEEMQGEFAIKEAVEREEREDILEEKGLGPRGR